MLLNLISSNHRYSNFKFHKEETPINLENSFEKKYVVIE